MKVGTFTAVLFAFSILASGAVTTPPAPDHLECDALLYGRGIDDTHPTLSYHLPWHTRNSWQSAWQVEASLSKDALTAGHDDLWNSGKVSGSLSPGVQYAGKPLTSRKVVWWRVRVWNGAGVASAWSHPSHWSMGILTRKEWKANWVAADFQSPVPPNPMPIFRRVFHLTKPVKSAVVSVCGLGLFELRLNGLKVGKHLLDPGSTDYKKRCLYVTFNVTKYLHEGANCAGMLLGNGMYHVEHQRYMKFEGSFGEPRFILNMDVRFTDGTHRFITSDSHWRTAPGPVTLTGIYGNEDYDARLVQPGWDKPVFKPLHSWHRVIMVKGPGGALRAQMLNPVEVARVYKPLKQPEKLPDGSLLVDFGQNIAGRPVISVTGPPGSRVRLIWAEQLTNGKVVQGSVGYGWYTYTLRGRGIERYAPLFSYTGFRYLQVERVPAKVAGRNVLPVVTGVTAQMMREMNPPAGTFLCSSPLINSIHRLILMAEANNMVHLLTDCPTREKLGWLEQTYLMGPSFLDNWQIERLLIETATNIRESQHADGLVPDNAPEFGRFAGAFVDSPEWGSAAVIVPWETYLRYGNEGVLATSFPCMARYVDYLWSKSAHGLLNYGLGDWYDIGPHDPGISQDTPLGVTATATFYHDTVVVAKVAALLHLNKQSVKYSNLASAIRKAFDKRFVDSDAGTVANGSQCSYAMAYACGLLPRSQELSAQSALFADIEQHWEHTTVGEVGHVYELRTLAAAGQNSLITRMTLKTDYPSYGYQVVHGATSLTEAWDGPTRGDSQDHFMLGHIDEWLYQDLAGIQVNMSAAVPIVFHPAPVSELTWVRAQYHTVLGTVSSSWQSRGKDLLLTFSVPAGVRAHLYVPCSNPYAVSVQPEVRCAGVRDGCAFYTLGAGTTTVTLPLTAVKRYVHEPVFGTGTP